MRVNTNYESNHTNYESNHTTFLFVTNTRGQIKGEGRESADDLVGLHRDDLFGNAVLGISVSPLQ